MENIFQFSGRNVSRLPMDHHELMAMVVPRALLVLGNPDYVWLAEESGYVSCRASHEVWKALGIADRFGFSIVAGHANCALPNSQRPEVEAFVEMIKDRHCGRTLEDCSGQSISVDRNFRGDRLSAPVPGPLADLKPRFHLIPWSIAPDPVSASSDVLVCRSGPVVRTGV